jgi:hypothetical protein
MNFFDHKDLGNHLLQLCPKVVKHPVYMYTNVSINVEVNLNVANIANDWEMFSFHNARREEPG